MPMDRTKYPPNWDQIAAGVKSAVNWRCQDCQIACREPGEPFQTHRLTLTVAHINHVESDCREENLIALCSVCHLRYDRERRRYQQLAKKRIAAKGGEA